MEDPFLPADTSLEVARAQSAVYRQMTPGQRLELALEMTEIVRAISAAEVRHRHPEYTDREVQLAVIRMTLGEELFRKAYPGVNVRQ